MDQPVIFVVPLIQYLEIPEGYIADGCIKEAVRHLHFFKASHGNAAVLIKLPGNSAGDAVDLYTVGFDSRHAVRNHADEVAHATGRFQKVAFGKSHLGKRLIHGPDNNRRGIKGGKAAGSCGGVFVLIKQ